MSQHTAGPWRWVESSDGLKTPEGHALYGNLPALVAADGTAICDFGDDEQYYPMAGNAPSDANARLIAAAPEMYALLDTLAKTFTDTSTYVAQVNLHSMSPLMYDIRALLARLDSATVTTEEG